jgi:hypothetical protein
MGNRSKPEHSEEADSDPSKLSDFMRRPAADAYLRAAGRLADQFKLGEAFFSAID